MRTLRQRIQRVCGFQMVRRIPLEWVQWLGTRAQLKEVLQRLAINCVLDVGANQGQFGVTIRGIGYDGWILSFEPAQETFPELEHTAEDDNRWRVFPYALGAVNGKQQFNVNQDSVLNSFLAPRADSLERFPDNRIVYTESVEVRRLDDVFSEILQGIESPRIYLKMDTQGFDLEVIKGADSCLKSVLALQTEVSFKKIYEDMPSFIDSISALQERGFEVVAFSPVSSDLDELSAVEMDCIMARRPVPAG